ncbi:MAG TPA: sulfotransferase [Acidimicrobiales bacterium]|nr:sulfotransferase [Acidimicrobiales bacterium]
MSVGHEGVRCAPNLFMVGAPKSGTTAMGHYLNAHPDIFVAGRELNYFGTDLDFLTPQGVPWRISWEDYLGWFEGQSHKRYRADRSVFYLYSRTAAQEIRRHDPNSRVVVMLRDPVDQMYSEHSEMLFQGEEDLTDFADALAAEEDRKQGRRIVEGCHHAFGLFYRDVARYADQLERYFSTFGREQVHVIVFDDLVADPVETYTAVLQFLELDTSHQPHFAVVNGNKVNRSTILSKALRTTSPGWRKAGRMLVPSPTARARLRRRVRQLNTASRSRGPMDPELRRALEVEFEPEILRLESLLGRTLPGWRRSQA